MNEYVRNIKGMLISWETDCDMIAALVEEYIETVPTRVEKIKNSVSNRIELEKSVRSMISMLNGLCARYLQNEAENFLKLIPRVDMKVCERKVQAFAANCLALSIEMQTAKHYAEAGGGREDTRTIEYYTDIQRNLNTVLELASAADYRSALDIVENMPVLAKLETGVILKSILKSRRDPTDLISELVEVYQNSIDKIRGDQAKAHYTVVLVDDRPDILETVSGYLRDTYKVFALTGGLSTLKFLEMRVPDLFVLDIDMPDMDGITLAKNIRALPDHASTPIIILTSNATKHYLASAMKAGVDDFLVKPANKDLLIAKISKFLVTGG